MLVGGSGSEQRTAASRSSLTWAADSTAGRPGRPAVSCAGGREGAADGDAELPAVGAADGAAAGRQVEWDCAPASATWPMLTWGRRASWENPVLAAGRWRERGSYRYDSAPGMPTPAFGGRILTLVTTVLIVVNALNRGGEPAVTTCFVRPASSAVKIGLSRGGW